MTAAPVWLLDIDGVLNAITTEPDCRAWPADQWVRAEASCAGVEWPLLAARPVLDFVRRVHAEDRAEIRWHTTWQHEASAAAKALDLPDFVVQPSPEFAREPGQLLAGATPVGARWWKLGAAERVVAQERRPLLWTDDDADPQLDRVARQGLTGPATLIVCPRPEVGLTGTDLRRIDGFLASARPADRG